MANRRYSNEDNDNNNKNNETEDKSLEEVYQKRRDDRRKSEDRVIIAKQQLNNLIDNLKTTSVFGESDPKLKELLAKPKSFIRRSARKEEQFWSKGRRHKRVIILIKFWISFNLIYLFRISDQIDQKLVLAAKGIASTLSGEESKKTESDLLKITQIASTGD